MNSTVRAQSPEFPKARSVPREGNAVPHGRSGRAEGGSVCWGMRLRAASRQGRRWRRGRFRPGSPEPASRVHATGSWTRAGAPRGRDATGTGPRQSGPNTRAPARAPPAQTSTAPFPGPRGPGPPTATGSSSRTRSSRAAARSALSRPARRSRGERKSRRVAAHGPAHHGRRRCDPGGRRCAVQGSQRPSAPRSPAPALLTPTHAHAQRARAARLRLPAPSGSRHSRQALGSSGPFRAPAALRPLP